MYFNFKDVNAEAKVISCKVSSISCGDDNVKSTKTRQDYNYAQGKITHVSNKRQTVSDEFTFNVPSSIPFSIIPLRTFVVFLACRHCQLSEMFKFIWQLLGGSCCHQDQYLYFLAFAGSNCLFIARDLAIGLQLGFLDRYIC